MMQRFLLGLCLICWAAMLHAKPVSKATAQLVAQNFYLSHHTDLPAVQLTLAQVVNTRVFNSTSGLMEDLPLYYVFNVNTQDGFVMVTADDAAMPVMGYATEGTFDPSIKASNFEKWMEGYKEEMRYIIENNIAATPEITEQWATFSRGVLDNNGRSVSAVNPLLGAIKWNQSPVWNDLCPYDNAAGERSVVGCVATAMAQIMKFWGHPAQGTGFHSYNHSSYGTQSANYGNTTYNWAAMPNTVGSAESAKLSYHCGVAVDMMYSPSGSGAYSTDVPAAFTDYFGYKSTIQFVSRDNYTTSSWKAMLKVELDASRPMYYAGSGSGGGHAFVCDGYDVSDYFHYNWGWGGAYDGYFSVDALNPSGVGTGGGSGGFNSNHRVVRGIEPASGGGGGGSSIDLSMYSNMTLNPTSPVTYGTTFTITADVANLGTAPYNGDITAALLDASNNFVAYIETKTNVTYTNGYFYSLTFSSSGMSPAPVPGTYNIVLYQKQTGAANWKAVGNGSYTNLKPITIQAINSGGVNLYAGMTPSVPSIILGQAFTVSANFENASGSNFSGKFSIDIHDMQGSFIMTVEEKNMSLNAGNHYVNPVVFSNAGITTLAAGSYQLAAWMQPTGGAWELVGNGSFSNPIIIDIVEPAVSGDIYENNNTAGTAYDLVPSYIGTSATVSTPGANISSGTDFDYFKIYLPPGYSYFVDAEVLDSYNSAVGYDNDVLFTYNSGNGESEGYDNEFGSIVMPNGGTITFKVVSYYQGQTGTYSFQATINRGAVAVDRIEDDNSIRLYPIPANERLTLEFETSPMNVNQIEIFNALGQKIQSITGNEVQQQVQHISTQDWNSGMYWMLIHSDGNISRKSFVVSR